MLVVVAVLELQRLLTLGGWDPQPSPFVGLVVTVNSTEVHVVAPEDYQETCGADVWHVGTYNVLTAEYNVFAELPAETPVQQMLGHVLAAVISNT